MDQAFRPDNDCTRGRRALKSYFEEQRRSLEALRDDRAKVYGEILAPFVRMLTDTSQKSTQEAMKEVRSLEYRMLAFRLALVGDDEVVTTWNNMWALIYKMGEDNSIRKTDVIERFGDVLLAIRRGLGIKKTVLSNKDMLRWLIKDIDSMPAAK